MFVYEPSGCDFEALCCDLKYLNNYIVLDGYPFLLPLKTCFSQHFQVVSSVVVINFINKPVNKKTKLVSLISQIDLLLCLKLLNLYDVCEASISVHFLSINNEKASFLFEQAI